MPLAPALFLDRDGVLIEEVGYLSHLDQLQPIPGAASLIRLANGAGWRVALISNQSVVARGLFPESFLAEVHGEIAREVFEEAGAIIDGFYHCPHHPSEGRGEYRIDCECRKPKPGMLLRAAADLGIDLAKSWLIGDRRTDLEAGAAAGCRTILVRTGYGSMTGIDGPDASLNLVAVLPSVAEAAAVIGL